MINSTVSTVLITGGTGFIGSQLTKLLQTEGFRVTHLSRSVSGKEKVKTYAWDIENGYIENGAVEQADYIIHLAGANIAQKRWTKERKKIIIDSRVKSAELIYNKASKSTGKLNAFISASGVGYYGTITSEKIFNEDDSAGSDFTAYTCKLWEEAALRFSNLGIRTVRVRTAIVFGTNGGALQKLANPINNFLGAPLGSGNQYFPWIHINDLCRIYLKAIQDQTMQGVYNAAAPYHVTNKDLTKTIAKVLHKPLILPNVPAIAIKIVMGELGDAILKGSRISSEKIRKAGFHFNFPDIKIALEDCLK
ncbi:MAG: TIGR01777 family protein [Bacteroidetes bacterium]|nr:TIGR01777 family protein [Bacteroidota bacterium]HET6245643.1 TIGR01777 family oxidoreductase [Bacteroidia bacterium]